MNIIKNVGRFFIGTTLVLTMASCQNDVERASRPQKPRMDIELTRAEQEIVNSHAKFAFDLFHEMNKQGDAASSTAENMIISPLSVSLDLSIVANAIDDESYSQFLQLMHLHPSTTREELNNISAMLVDELINVDSQVILNVANSIWTKPGLKVKQSFADEVMKQYNASCTPVAFWKKESEDIINSWAKKATEGLIPKIHQADPGLESIVSLFCNALYFNGEWVYQFDKDKTAKKDFYNLDGSKVRVSMMHGETDAVNLRDDDISIIGLPFGNRAYRMFFILPDSGVDFNKCLDDFDYEKWNGYKDKFFFSGVSMSLPRIDLNCKTDMNEALTGMGLDLTVNPKNMFEDNVGDCLLQVSQLCNFKVEEVGVEAAAITIGSVSVTAITSLREFRIDRPFFFLIEEQSTGTILFMGKITNL